MKQIVIISFAFLASCNQPAENKADVKSDYDRTTALVNDNLTKLDSLTGAMENTDSFSLERFGASVNMKDSLYKLMDSLIGRQQYLDSLLKEEGKSR